jgi:hypothetical protein
VSGSVSSLLARPVARYISAQRDHLEKTGTAISLHPRAPLNDYFRPVDLDRVRIVERDPLPMPALPFSNTARRLGLDLPDVSLVAAITFDHIIASRQPLTSALLFHELVHAVQFRLLGSVLLHGFTSGDYCWRVATTGFRWNAVLSNSTTGLKLSDHLLRSSAKSKNGLSEISYKPIRLSRPARLGDSVPNPLGFTAFRQNGSFLVGGSRRPPSGCWSALRSHPCVAVSSAQVRPV